MPGFTLFPEAALCRRWLSTGLIWLVSASLLPAGFAEDSRDSSARSGTSKPTFSATVKVVNLFATVRDKHGQIISNLSKDDFALEEDGRTQTIKYFTRETDLPLKLGLLVDTSMSTLSALPDERNASTTFLNKIVREEKDSAFVIHFDREVELLQDLTSSKEKLASATEEIEPTRRDDQGNSGGGHRHFGGGGTLLYDAIFLASDELMQKQQGRKALILLTDGDDRGSKTSLESAIESAQRANTLVYCIYFKGEEPATFGRFGGQHGGWGRGGMGRPGGGRFPQQSHEDGKKVLERIAKETGGRMFEISKKQSADNIYSQIEQELRNQYSIGYTPERGGTSSAYHKIHLAAKDKNDVVQTRDGYYD
jgi:VWFA-related protein